MTLAALLLTSACRYDFSIVGGTDVDGAATDGAATDGAAADIDAAPTAGAVEFLSITGTGQPGPLDNIAVDVDPVEPGAAYIAAVVTRRDFEAVTAIDGLGLTWSPLIDGCGGSGGGLSVWFAESGAMPAPGLVTATLDGGVGGAAIAVVQYANVREVGTTTSLESANGGDCDGGAEFDSFQHTHTPQITGSIVLMALAHREDMYTATGDQQNRLALNYSNNPTMGIAIADTSPVIADQPVTLSGTFSGGNGVDEWTVAAIELTP